MRGATWLLALALATIYTLWLREGLRRAEQYRLQERLACWVGG